MQSQRNAVLHLLSQPASRDRLAKVTFIYLKKSIAAGKLHEPPDLRELALVLTTDTARVALKRAEELDADRQLWPWLFTIAKNVVRGHVRDEARQWNAADEDSDAAEAVSLDATLLGEGDEGVGLLDLLSHPDNHADQTDAVLDVERVLAEAAPADAALLRRHYLNGDSYEEIAEDAGTTVAAVKQKVYRARYRLRRALVERGYHEARQRDAA